MATQGGSALFQFSRVPGQAICHTCGVELASHEKLRWKKKALEMRMPYYISDSSKLVKPISPTSCHKATEGSLEQERAHFRDFIGFLDTLEIPRRADLNDNVSIGTIWLEGNDMKGKLEHSERKAKGLEQELRSTRDDLQHKRLLLEELSRNFEVAPESTSMSPTSESSGEEK